MSERRAYILSQFEGTGGAALSVQEDIIKKRTIPDTEHGKSKNSNRAQHIYAIVNIRTGQVAKFGISSSELNKNGTSKRANTQVNSSVFGKDKFYTVVIAEHIKGRREALRIERNLVTDYFILNKRRPAKNLRPSIDFNRVNKTRGKK